MLQDSRPPEACLLVHPANRRRGIGRGLVEAARGVCRGDGAAELLLTLDEASVAGRGFVEALGARFSHAEYALELESVPPERDWEPLLELRPTGLAELETFARIRAAAFGDPPGVRREELAERMRAPGNRHWLAVIEGRPIGTIRAAAHGPVVYVTSFAVLPELQGRGLGRQILTRTVRALDAPVIRIEVETTNENALGLYRSCGFTRQLGAYGYYALAL